MVYSRAPNSSPISSSLSPAPISRCSSLMMAIVSYFNSSYSTSGTFSPIARIVSLTSFRNVGARSMKASSLSHSSKSLMSSSSTRWYNACCFKDSLSFSESGKVLVANNSAFECWASLKTSYLLRTRFKRNYWINQMLSHFYI